MAKSRGNDKSPDYSPVWEEPPIGTVIQGFKLIENYKRFNLWQRQGPAGVRPYKTCFPRKTVPNHKAVKTILFDAK